MPSGFRNSAGVDFDDLFDPYVQGTKPSETGFRTNDGTDLRHRFAPIAHGFKGPDVGFRNSAGVDLSNLWAAAGTAVYLVNAISESQSFTGAATSANISIRAKTNGEIDFTCTPGNDTTVNYVPTPGAGAGSGHQVRIFGTVNGLRNSATATAGMTGKGGVSFTAAVNPGNSAPFDTGWQSPDDANDILDMQANSTGNGGAGIVDGSATVQVRRTSDNQIVREFGLGFSCTADSQQ